MQQQQRKKHEQAIEHDANGAPIIVRVANHLVTLERMLRYRAQALVDQAETPQVLFHYAKEKSAIQASLATLRYHRATIQRLPEPLGMLRQLVAANDSGDQAEVGRLLEAARGLLLTYPAEGEMLAPENDYPETAAR